MERADDGAVDADIAAAGDGDVGADLGGELFGQPVAQNDGVGRTVQRGQLALAHLRLQVRDLCFAARIDAGDRDPHVTARIADQALGGDRRRHRARNPCLHRRYRRHRVLDAAAANLGLQPVDFGGCIALLARLRGRLAALVRDGDVRQYVDQRLDEVVLRALHQGSHHDREADAGGDPESGNQRLPCARAHVSPGDIENEIHFLAAAVTFTRAPSASPGGTGASTISPSFRPLTISVARVPRKPTSTLRR